MSKTDSISRYAASVTLASERSAEPRISSRVCSSADLETRLPGLLRLSDWFGIVIIGLVVEALFPGDGAGSVNLSLGIVLGATVTANLLQLEQAYSTRSAARLASQTTKVTVSWAFAFLGVALIAYATGHAREFLGTWAISWFALSLLFLLATRCGANHQVLRWRREGRSIRNIAVLGSRYEALALASRVRQNAGEAHLVGVFVDDDLAVETGSVAGNGDQLAELAATGEVDEVVIASPAKSPVLLNHALAKLAACQVEVGIALGLPEMDYPLTELGLVAGVPTLKVQRRPLAGWGAPVKRIEDVLLSSVLLLALSPLFLITSLAVKLDSRGPVLFRQERYGFNNRRIWIFKFRSMRHDPYPDRDVPQTRRNDPRLTRIGGFLRRTSLDELPQLLNVLRGEMSLVGPRPHAAVHNEKYARMIEGYLGRHRMKPGLTGWAQVNGQRGAIRGVDEMKLRLEYDRYYMANWSLLLDIKILLMTVPAVLRGINAY